MLSALMSVALFLLLLPLVLVVLVGERGRWHPSTWRLFWAGRFRPNVLHGYIYGRWTPQYIKALFSSAATSPKATKGEFWLSRHYHGKVLSHEHARSLVTLNEPIKRDLEQIIPYPAARDLVLQASPDVVAYECVCRTLRKKHCAPTRVCMVVGKPFTDFILEHHPDRSQRLSREEALELLAAEHQRGHVHSAWFKDAMLNRFYAICNCCKCCCGGIHEMTMRGVSMVASSGYVAKIDSTLCANCDECVDACPFGALSHSNGEVVHDWERCLGCGVCEVKCATGAISMFRDERKGIPLDVRAIAATHHL